MLHTEYVRNMNCNYERILLDKQPEENRYQYCILSRGGIKGLLPCSLRYMNGLAYLYYDISSRQNVSQLYSGRCIARKWMKDFLWSLKRIQQELGRFLLDTGNILWYPEQIFQDLESNIFSYVYVPYYEGELSFIKLIEFWVEHIDYDDEVLVDFVYHMYEQVERNGSIYLQGCIFEDARCLEESGDKQTAELVKDIEEGEKENQRRGVAANGGAAENAAGKEGTEKNHINGMEEGLLLVGKQNNIERGEKRGIFSFIEGIRNRNKKQREDYNTAMRQAMSGYAVAEEVDYISDDYGKTIFIEEKQNEEETQHGLYTSDGKLLMKMEGKMLSIGKKKEEVTLALEDVSVSRMHARIMEEQGEYYVEDLNSTNGTFKNGLRMQPYEKRKLETGDEIKCGKIIVVFR